MFNFTKKIEAFKRKELIKKTLDMLRIVVLMDLNSVA